MAVTQSIPAAAEDVEDSLQVSTLEQGGGMVETEEEMHPPAVVAADNDPETIEKTELEEEVSEEHVEELLGETAADDSMDLKPGKTVE